MNILIITEHLGFGGVERFAVNLANGMVTAGRAASLATLLDAPNDLQSQLDGQVKQLSFGLRNFKNPLATFRGFMALLRHLRGTRYDQIIAAKPIVVALTLLACILTGKRRKLVVSVHENPQQVIAVNRGARRWFFVFCYRFLYRFAYRLVAVSSATVEALAAMTGRAPQVIYNPVITPQMLEYSMEPPVHPWLAHKTCPVLLSVGRLSAEKNLPLLIDAFAKLKAQHACRLLILGEGPQEAQLRALVKGAQLAESIDMPGYTANPYALMAHADALVLSSNHEALPTVLIEAMACGCPVISTDCPFGPREILADGRYGTLVPMNDVDALAAAMEMVLASGLYHESLATPLASSPLEGEREQRGSPSGNPLLFRGGGYQQYDAGVSTPHQIPPVNGEGKEGGFDSPSGGGVASGAVGANTRRIAEAKAHALTFSQARAVAEYTALARPNSLCFFMNDLAGGGAELVSVKLINGFEALGVATNLVLTNAKDAYSVRLTHPRITHLDSQRRGIGTPLTWFRLLRHLYSSRPEAIISGIENLHYIAILAHFFYWPRVPLLCVLHTTLSADWQRPVPINQRIKCALSRLLLARQTRIVAVSHAVARDAEALLGRPTYSIHVIYNAVVDDALVARVAKHQRAASMDIPLILAVGGLRPVKNYPLLLRAFAVVRGQLPCRLRILGEGSERAALDQLAAELGVADAVEMPGFTDDPIAHMLECTVLALSSYYEGLPSVLIEALACGCAIVATDCPSGPCEILADGRHGVLVPVGDVAALATALQQALTHPLSDAERAERIAHAAKFSVPKAAHAYLSVLG